MRGALVCACLVVCGCAGEPGAEAPVAHPARDAADAPPGYPTEAARWQHFHSKRFALTLPFPDGRSWRIDDHSRPFLVGTQASTRSTANLIIWSEDDLMNRAKCEARARERGFVPTGRFTTVADEVTVGPDAYDTRVWVALQPGASEASPMTGHLLAFGAYVRKCLFFRLTSEVPSGRYESVLSSRLAAARVEMFGRIDLDAFAAVKREEHER